MPDSPSSVITRFAIDVLEAAILDDHEVLPKLTAQIGDFHEDPRFVLGVMVNAWIAVLRQGLSARPDLVPLLYDSLLSAKNREAAWAARLIRARIAGDNKLQQELWVELFQRDRDDWANAVMWALTVVATSVKIDAAIGIAEERQWAAHLN